MIRLFVAIDVPDNIRLLLSGMGRSIPGLKPVSAEQLHLTLKFLGDTEPSALDEIVTALSSIRHQPITMAIRSVGHFPPRGEPRVIWAGIDPSKKVIKLRNKVEKALSDIGIKREKRKFYPHITLTRLKNSPVNRVGQFLAENAMLETPPFTVSDFHLYSSILTPKGALHRREETFQLS